MVETIEKEQQYHNSIYTAITLENHVWYKSLRRDYSMELGCIRNTEYVYYFTLSS